MGRSSTSLPTTNQEDLLRWSTKKNKRPSPTNGDESEGSPTDTTDWPELPRTSQPPTSPATTNFGDVRTFTEAIQVGRPRPPIFLGDGKEDNPQDLDVPDQSSLGISNTRVGSTDWPLMEMFLEDCKQLWQPWRRALVAKTLGKNVSFKILGQWTKELWKLQWGCEIIDLEHGYFVVRFYSKEDYLKVLEKGPRVVQGHYLVVNKWKPNFRPSIDKITSALV